MDGCGWRLAKEIIIDWSIYFEKLKDVWNSQLYLKDASSKTLQESLNGVNRQMAKKSTVNRQKRNLFTVNRQMSERKLAVKFFFSFF